MSKSHPPLPTNDIQTPHYDMDTTQTTHLSLCSGYGGIDLGLRRAIPDLRTIAYAEIEAFAVENLLARMEGGQLDPAPIWPDIKSFPWRAFSDRVDILSGGYPCQPFSAAGKRLGTDDPRHLWPFIANGIRILRPKLCFFENVEGHISLGLREVISELESMGYAVSWGIFSASEVGAPHQRKRVFVMAHRDCERGQLSNWWRESAEQVPVSNGEERRAWPSRPGQPQHAFEPPRVVGDTMRSDGFTNQTEQAGSNGRREVGDTGYNARVWSSRPGQPQHAFEPPRVVANSASERTNGGQQLCDEECGQGRALPLQSDDSGKVVGNADCLDRRTSASGWIDDAEAGSAGEIVGDAQHNGLHQCGQEARGQESCGEQGGVQESERGSASMGNTEGGMPRKSSAGDWREGAGGAGERGELGNAESIRSTALRAEYEGLGGELCSTSAGGEGIMGNADCGRQSCGINTRSSSETIGRGEGDIEQTECGQTESTLGGDANGTANWMDYAELCVSCDNRTDELRLLGNGVVPATATLAFKTLLAELLSQ